MKQFDAVTVDHAGHGGLGRETVGIMPARAEETEQAGSVRRIREQLTVISGQPTPKRPLSASFESVQRSGGCNFARIQVGPAVSVVRNFVVCTTK
jgi:hypothetical protein